MRAENGNPGNEGAVTGWPSGTLVQVNIANNGHWDSNQLSAITQAIQSWEGVGGVVLSVTVDDSSVVQNSLNTITVKPTHLSEPGQTQGVAHGNTDAGTDDNTHQTYTATVDLNEYISGIDDLARTVAHEMGHTFGLEDNENSTSSVMSDHCLDWNGSNCGATSPTAEDISAADCEDQYPYNQCFPNYPNAATCTCAAGAPNNCSSGQTCINGACGCVNICDSPNCGGYDYCICNPNNPGCGGGDQCQSLCDPYCPYYDLCTCEPWQCYICTDPCNPECPDYDPYQC